MPTRLDVPLPAPRKGTWHFLRFARRFSPVYLSVDVDMSAVVEERARLLAEGRKISYIAFVIARAAEALRKHPEANSSVRHSVFPRLARYADIDAKFTLDKVVDGERVVVPGLIRHADRLGLPEIQDRIDYYRDMPVDDNPELKGARVLRRLPFLLGRWVYGFLLSDLGRRKAIQGTFTVTSLGHRPIGAFFPISTATVALGVGAILDKPVVREGRVAPGKVMTLGMAFDHAAIDGAAAADFLSEVKDLLEAPARALDPEILRPALSDVAA